MKTQEQNHQSIINQLKRENEIANNQRTELLKGLRSFIPRINQLEERKQSLLQLPEVPSHNKHVPTAKGILMSQCHQIFELSGIRENFGEIRKLI